MIEMTAQEEVKRNEKQKKFNRLLKTISYICILLFSIFYINSIIDTGISIIKLLSNPIIATLSFLTIIAMVAKLSQSIGDIYQLETISKQDEEKIEKETIELEAKEDDYLMYLTLMYIFIIAVYTISVIGEAIELGTWFTYMLIPGSLILSTIKNNEKLKLEKERRKLLKIKKRKI